MKRENSSVSTSTPTPLAPMDLKNEDNFQVGDKVKILLSDLNSIGNFLRLSHLMTVYSVLSIKRTGSLNYFEVFAPP